MNYEEFIVLIFKGVSFKEIRHKINVFIQSFGSSWAEQADSENP